MNQTHSQAQVSTSENFSLCDTPTVSTSSEASTHSTAASDFHVTSQVGSMQPPNYQPLQQTFQTIPAPTNLVHPNIFFYRPPNGFCHYYVNCKEISYDTVTYLLNKLKECNIQSNENEFIFYYQQQYDKRFYELSCEIVSPLLIDNCLNKNFLGIELQQNAAQEHLSFTFGQKENLEHHLKQYLSQYLLN
ncbi:hypothetical protein C1645_805239 [Glomus cerebriforme]|uniref:Uncharacterized protein n=1 Tax=Glomus cerebriforme TaxID=658196 RepID=A0A397T596_9GLOM|nr:hypothetical protein C1645_805239 [Glomus cerebriforme]